MTPRLYILLREDLGSMTPGRAAAQASHATSLFAESIRRSGRSDFSNETWEALDDWQSATSQGFGTVIVLGCDGVDLALVEAELEEDYLVGVVNDPSYPLRDGGFVHLLDIDTAAFVFVPDIDEEDDLAMGVLDRFKLF